MKKILLTIACLLTSLAMVQAVSLTWNYNSSTAGASVDETGAAIQAGWIVQLVSWDGSYQEYSVGSVDSGTVGVQPFPPFATTYSSIFVTPDTASTYYVRMFNASSVGAATYYVNLGVNGGADYYTTNAGDLSNEETFNVESADQASWVAIPEPGTIILFGLGALVIGARKKFRK